FVPFDQIGKLALLRKGQTRANHTYVMASSIRFSNVFVPGSFSNKNFGTVSTSGEGVWRNVLLVGRGPGGKSYTALDVTVPGPFTTNALSSTPPIIVWNRGN